MTLTIDFNRGATTNAEQSRAGKGFLMTNLIFS
jgi:hypothetical protein